MSGPARGAELGVWNGRILERRGGEDEVVGVDDVRTGGDAEAGGGIGLRIEIDDQDVAAHRCQRGAEIDRRRGLADPALLIGDGEHATGGALFGGGTRCGGVIHRQSRNSSRISTAPSGLDRLGATVSLICHFLRASVNSSGK